MTVQNMLIILGKGFTSSAQYHSMTITRPVNIDMLKLLTTEIDTQIKKNLACVLTIMFEKIACTVLTPVPYINTRNPHI